MPNWCTNKLCITGKRKDIEDFFSALKGKPAQYANFQVQRDYSEYVGYSFGAIVPIPEEVIDCRSWKEENWGTKWDPFAGEEMALVIDNSCQELSNFKPDEEVTVEIVFYSAWTPPIAFFKTASAKFPQLRFKLDYAEYRCNFSGCIELYGGDLVFMEEDPCEVVSVDGKGKKWRPFIFIKEAIISNIQFIQYIMLIRSLK